MKVLLKRWKIFLFIIFPKTISSIFTLVSILGSHRNKRWTMHTYYVLIYICFHVYLSCHAIFSYLIVFMYTYVWAYILQFTILISIHPSIHQSIKLSTHPRINPSIQEYIHSLTYSPIHPCVSRVVIINAVHVYISFR